MKRDRAWRWALRSSLGLAFLVASGIAQAQTREAGLTSRLFFGGDTSSVGGIYKLDPSVGYRFNRHFSISAGLPTYFVRPSATASADGSTSKNGIGNFYLDLRLETSGSDTYFRSALRGTAPTGDRDSGFSTGRVTVDWTNYVSRSFGPLTPFGRAGIGSTVSDTHFFTRPFSSLGLVGNLEGGAELALSHGLSLAGSGYAIVPSGQQKIFSKLVRRGTKSVVVGTEEIARDHGASVWLGFDPARQVSLELGYSRSVAYDYNSVFFNILLDLGRIAKMRRP